MELGMQEKKYKKIEGVGTPQMSAFRFNVYIKN